MNTTTPDISIVIPVYNSQPTLQRLYAEISAALGARNWEVIFVDDGSRDNSWLELQNIKRDHPETVRVIRLSRNFGQHNAIACGFGFVRGNVVITMDDDLQHPPCEIPKLIAKAAETNADVVYGQYISKQHSGWRNAGSWTMRRTSRYLSNNSGIETSFRLISTPVARKIAEHPQAGILFIDEVLHWYTNRIELIPVEHRPRQEGKSTYSRTKLFGLYLDMIIHYTAFPLKLMTWIGLAASVITFLLGVRFLWMKFMYGSLPGFTAIIVVVLFSTSLLMFCMGIIGQYLFKLYQLQNRRPPFAVAEVL